MSSDKRVVCGQLKRRPLRSSRHVAPTTHRKLLLEVAFKLRPNEVEELRFSVRDAVPDETAEEIPTTFGLLECLERHRLLGPGNYSSLREYLVKMGREDLAGLLAPPEDLGGSPKSATGSLSRIVTCLGVDRAVWHYNTFRSSSLDVFRELSEGEVEQIRWLAQDFFAKRFRTPWLQRMTGVELVTVMEDSGLIGPGNYSFLINCLEEIGRLDLVLQIFPPTLPHLPASMDLPALLRHQHFEKIQLKQKQYQFGMNSLMMVTSLSSQKTSQMAAGWHKRILGALSPKSLQEHSSYIVEHLPTTLINTSLHVNDLLDSLLEYERHGDTARFAQHVSNCEQHLDILQSLMEEIDWDHIPRKREKIATSRQYHPVRQASYGAYSGVAELLLEFSSSREQLQQESRNLSLVLTRLESLLRLSGYMWSLTSWLVASLQVAVRSPNYLGGYDFLFRLLVQRNRHIIRSNSDMLQSVLAPLPVGRKLLGSFKHQNLVLQNPITTDSKTFMFHRGGTPIPVFAFVLLILSEHPSLNADDVEEIIASLKLYIGQREEAFCKINGAVTTMVLQGIGRNIEAFRNSQLQEFHSNDMRGVADIFSL